MHRLLGKFRSSDDEPYVPPKNPFQTFLLALACLSSFPLIQGDAGSAVLEAALDNSTVIFWGWCLGGGCGVALIGLWLPEKHAIFSLNLERAGMIVVAGAAAIYAYVVYKSAGSDASEVRYALSIQLAFSAACFWRCIQITKALRWSLRNVGTVRGE